MLLLTKFSLKKENFSENKNLPRIVGSNKDHMYILNHLHQNSDKISNQNAQTLTPERSNQSIKH